MTRPVPGPLVPGRVNHGGGLNHGSAADEVAAMVVDPVQQPPEIALCTRSFSIGNILGAGYPVWTRKCEDRHTAASAENVCLDWGL